MVLAQRHRPAGATTREAALRARCGTDRMNSPYTSAWEIAEEGFCVRHSGEQVRIDPSADVDDGAVLGGGHRCLAPGGVEPRPGLRAAVLDEGCSSARPWCSPTATSRTITQGGELQRREDEETLRGVHQPEDGRGNVRGIGGARDPVVGGDVRAGEVPVHVTGGG